MARNPKPWFRDQTHSWYVKISGTQHPLGKHPIDKAPQKVNGEWRPPEEIKSAWHRLMASEGLAKPIDNISLRGLIEQFLVDAATTCTDETADWYRRFLEDFAERYPKIKPEDITARVVRAWLTAPHKRPWQQSTRRSAVIILKRLLNWAVHDAKLLAENPIEDFKPETAIASERILDDEEKSRILSWYPEGDPFRDLLIAWEESGCRPGEAAKVTAADVDLKADTWTIKGKTTRRTGRDRVIYMTPTLREITIRLIKKHPDGPIFRNADGNPWTLQAINCRFRRKRKRKHDPLDADVTAKVYRTTWATDALENQVGDATVAELMGHRSTAMLHRHYSKLREKQEHLRKSAAKAVKKKEGGD